MFAVKHRMAIIQKDIMHLLAEKNGYACGANLWNA